jgi:carbonic anhydrase
MGHESCGAVKAAVESKSAAPSPNLDYLLKSIQAARKPSTQERDEIKALVLANVEQVIIEALSKSVLLQRLVDDGRLSVVGAYYEMVSGRVMFSEAVTAQTLPSRQARH